MYERKPNSPQSNLCAEWRIENVEIERQDKTLLLDRDGVVIKDHGYVNELDRTEFILPIINLVQFANQHACNVSIVTNQAGVAHGFFSEEELILYNLDLLEEMSKAFGSFITNFYYCPSHPNAKVTRYNRSCFCRKPEAGLIFESQKALGVPLRNTYFLGDKESDRLAAASAGIKFLMYKEGDELDTVFGWLETKDGRRC